MKRRQFIAGFAAALLLQQTFRGRALVRTLTLLPWIIPGVVVGLIWEWLYQPNYGVINDLLMRAGLMQERVAWPSICTVQAPHSARPQPKRGPCRCRWSRST